MLTGTSHSATFLLNKAFEGMGKSALEQTEKKRPPSKMHRNSSTTVVVECFAERKSHTRLSSLEGLFEYNWYSWLLSDAWI